MIRSGSSGPTSVRIADIVLNNSVNTMTTDIEAADPARAGSTSKRPSRLATVSKGFRSLRIRNFRLFIFGQVISVTGSWMQTTAQAWLVLRLSSSPLATGLVATLQFLPITVLALYGGVLADRLPKRSTLIVTQSLLLVQATIFGLLVVTNSIQLWHIYVLAAMQGIISAVDNPVRQSFVVEMVGRDELVNAVALNSMTFNAGRIIGPSAAGLLISQVGTAPALFLNAVSFIAVIVALSMMRTKELFTVSGKLPQGRTFQQLREGVLYAWHNPVVMSILIVVGAIGTFGYNFSVVLPLLSDYVLHADSSGFGILSACFGAGALIAAISTAYVKQVTIRRLLISGAVFSILLGLIANIRVFGLSAMLLAAIGGFGIIFLTSASSLLQLIVPNELRGRVMSLHVLLVMGSTPIGGFLIGALSDRIGVSVALFTCSILCLVGVGASLYYQQRHRPSVPAHP